MKGNKAGIRSHPVEGKKKGSKGESRKNGEEEI